MILFMVEMGNAHVLTYAYDREAAKSNGRKWMGGNADSYIVTPLTEDGDRIHLDITVAV